MPMRERFQRFIDATNRPPLLTIRKILWVVLSGWVLFLLYAFAAVAMCLTIIFIPFGIQAFRFALFALCPIGREPYSKDVPDATNIKTMPWHNPLHPLTIAGNIVWDLLFGWAIATAHLAMAVIQALTIIGISTAIQNVRLAFFALWPFGKSIRKQEQEREATKRDVAAAPPTVGPAAV